MNSPPSMSGGGGGTQPPVTGMLSKALWKPSNPLPQVGRFGVFIAVGAGVTVALSLMMYSMIRYRQTTLAKDTGYKNANFIRLKQDSEVTRRTREMPKKVVQKVAPQTPTLAVKSSSSSKVANLNLKIDVPDTPSLGGKFSLLGGAGVGSGTNIRDAEYMPIFRTKPMYPPEAHDREVEGWVDVRYTVNKQGRIVNPKVVNANPPSVFNRAALDCVKKWKYRPKMRDGKTVDTPNVETRITFSLRDAN